MKHPIRDLIEQIQHINELDLGMLQSMLKPETPAPMDTLSTGVISDTGGEESFASTDPEYDEHEQKLQKEMNFFRECKARGIKFKAAAEKLRHAEYKDVLGKRL